MMKSLIAICLTAMLLTACNSTENNSPIAADSAHSNSAVDFLIHETPAYDSALAAALGGDEYGMHPYVMAILKAGPNRDQDSAATDSIMHAHLKNIMRMADEGKLIVAGPFLDDTELKGIYIFNVATVEEAEALTKTDPAIQSGRLVMELHPWYGSSAMQLINNLHHRVEKRSVAE